MECRRIEFGMHPKPGAKQPGQGNNNEGDDIKRHMSFTRVPMRSVQPPTVVDVLPDELHTWQLGDVLFGCWRNGSQIEPIHTWPIELC